MREHFLDQNISIMKLVRNVEFELLCFFIYLLFQIYFIKIFQLFFILNSFEFFKIDFNEIIPKSNWDLTNLNRILQNRLSHVFRCEEKKTPTKFFKRKKVHLLNYQLLMNLLINN